MILCLYQVSKRIYCIRHKQHSTLYLDVRDTCNGNVHLNGFRARRLICSNIRIRVHNNMRYWIRY